MLKNVLTVESPCGIEPQSLMRILPLDYEDLLQLVWLDILNFGTLFEEFIIEKC